MHRQPQPVTVDTHTVVRILLLITVFLASIWLILVLRRELVWIGVAFFLAVALDPAVNWIAKTVHSGRLLATSIVFILFIIVLSILGVVFVPPLVTQSEQLINQLPHFLQHAQNTHTEIGHLVQQYHLVDRAREVQSHLLSDVAAGTDTAVGILLSAFYGVTATVTTLVLTFFMLLEGPSWVTMGFRYVPVSEHSHYHRLTSRMYNIVASYVTGNLIIALGVAILSALIYAVLGIPYAIPLGIWTGLTTLIPVIGGVLGLVSVGAVALLTTGTTSAIIVAIYFCVYIFIDSHLLRPVVFGRTIQMSPLMVMIAIVLGTALDGIVGALVAIPAAACLGVLLSDMVGEDIMAGGTNGNGSTAHHPAKKR